LRYNRKIRENNKILGLHNTEKAGNGFTFLILGRIEGKETEKLSSVGDIIVGFFFVCKG